MSDQTPPVEDTRPPGERSPIQYPTTKLTKIINAYRERHGAPPLKVSDKLAASAQAWAERGIFEHSKSDGTYAECLWAHSQPGNGETLQWAADSWYEEAEELGYDYDHPDTVEGDRAEWNKGVGHFTQLVWKSSTHLGVGVAFHPQRKWKCIVVAHFGPPGNVLGSFKENVLPPK